GHSSPSASVGFESTSRSADGLAFLNCSLGCRVFSQMSLAGSRAVPCPAASLQGTRAVAAIRVRSVPLAQTRALRRCVLRPHQSIEEMLDTEPEGAHAVGAFDGEELIAVGLIGPDADR